jgi:putative oxidoreductase
MIDSRTAPYGALLLRVSLGALALAHGLLKLLVFGLPGVVGFFGSLGLPAFVAYVVVAIEVLGGAALVLGWQTRIAALAMVPVLLGTIFTVHGAKGWMFGVEGGGWEFPAFWAAALVVQSLLGDGACALGARRTSA